MLLLIDAVVRMGESKYHRPPQTTTDHHRSPQTTTDHTTDHHRPQNKLFKIKIINFKVVKCEKL